MAIESSNVVDSQDVPAEEASFSAAASGGRISSISSGQGISLAVRDGQKRIRPPKLYRIGEVVDYSGMSRQTIHNYTIIGLIHESKWTSGSHRLYDESVFERLDQIAHFKNQNKSLEDIREFFIHRDASE